MLIELIIFFLLQKCIVPRNHFLKYLFWDEEREVREDEGISEV